jgi:V8-like Glu-specific endopeptidase
MIRFHQTFGAHAGRVVEFDRPTVRFGRMPDCDVSFDPNADLDASGRHAEVRLEAGSYFVVDGASRNGTWVNGQRIDRAEIKNGDEIEFGLGGPRMRVEIVGGREVTGPMAESKREPQVTQAATPVSLAPAKRPDLPEQPRVPPPRAPAMNAGPMQAALQQPPPLQPPPLHAPMHAMPIRAAAQAGMAPAPVQAMPGNGGFGARGPAGARGPQADAFAGGGPFNPGQGALTPLPYAPVQPLIGSSAPVAITPPAMQAADPVSAGKWPSPPAAPAGASAQVAWAEGPGLPSQAPASSPRPYEPPHRPPHQDDRKFGQKTVAMMIQSAVQQANSAGQTGGTRSTAFIRAVATEAVQHSSRGLKWAVAILSVLFFLALVAITVLVVINIQATSEARRETERLEDRVDHERTAGTRITETYSRAIYLLVEQSSEGERGVCTAFSVRPTLLATNAHCVIAMEEGMRQGSTFSALPNGAIGGRLGIQRMWRHPGYSHDADHPTEDVGLVEVAGTATVQVELANAQQLEELATGEEIFVYGFPGDLANPTSPVATITSGVIGRMTAFDGTGSDFAHSQLIQHNAFTSPGTSGSPIFDHRGLVIGVNAGTFRSAQRVDVVGPNGPSQQTVVTESGYKYGVRADLLLSLIAGLGQ